MGFRNREKETKMLVLGTSSLKTVARELHKLFGYETSEKVIGYSRDTYWPPTKNRADFTRLRWYHNSKKGQLTVKFTDKKSIRDRIEIDVEVDDARQCLRLMKRSKGDPRGTIRKTYYVHFLEDEDTVMSVYQMKKDKRVFVEAEAKTLRRMNSLIKKAHRLPWKLKKMNKALYKIALGGRK